MYTYLYNTFAWNNNFMMEVTEANLMGNHWWTKYVKIGHVNKKTCLMWWSPLARLACIAASGLNFLRIYACSRRILCFCSFKLFCLRLEIFQNHVWLKVTEELIFERDHFMLVTFVIEIQSVPPSSYHNNDNCFTGLMLPWWFALVCFASN